MGRFVVLIDWTETGVANFQASVDRYEAARGDFEALGVSIQAIYWTLGNHDIVTVIDAPDGQTLAAALLRLGSAGNVRTTTLRAFDAEEMRGIIAKAG
jgi:uncharacterized protein with GYD domain